MKFLASLRNLKTFTVVLRYPDYYAEVGHETCCFEVSAPDARLAAEEARRACIVSNMIADIENLTDIQVVSVMAAIPARAVMSVATQAA
jgi:hypothetical protein